MTSLNFLLSPEQISHAFSESKKVFFSQLEAIKKHKNASALLDLESALTTFSEINGPLQFLKYTSTNEDVRKASDVVETESSKILIELFADKGLYLAIKDLSPSQPDEKKLHSEYIRFFQQNGLTLSEENRKAFLDIKKRLVEIEAEFAKALVEEKQALTFSASELAGLPTPVLNRLKKNDQGDYLVTLSYPDYYPFMDYVTVEESRKKMEFAFYQKGGEANRKRLVETLELRKKAAQLLGYKNHADFVLEDRMAKSTENVMSFLEDLRKKLLPVGKKQKQTLLELKQKHTHNPQAVMNSYDWRFYDNLSKKMSYEIDTEKVKEYFPLSRVLEGMFSLYQTLLDVTFQPIENPKKWHPEVTSYSVSEKGKVISYFYMDLFPREGKYNHAAAFTIIPGHKKNDGTYQLPVSAIVANFNPPSADRLSLLDHSEVETLFHEFGHIMHQILTKARFATFSGTSVKRDFVEAPSQMLENWVWEKEILKDISGHYKNPKERLPDELIEKLIKAKNLNHAIKYLRQLVFATLDMKYHTEEKPNTTEIYYQLTESIGLFPLQKNLLPEAGFGHLMGGYDAGYYGYLWSEVFAADMYTRFQKEGLKNTETGKAYRDWILRPGGEKDPEELLTGFLGRKPNSQAFFEQMEG